MKNNTVLSQSHYLKPSNEMQIAQDILCNFIQGINSMHSILDESFTEVIDALSNIAGRIIVTGIGKSGHIGRKFAATLASTGKAAYFVHTAEANHGDMGMITPNDMVLFISNSGESEEMLTVLQYCKSLEIKTMLITRNKNAMMSQYVDYNIIIPKIEEAADVIDAPTTSALQTLAICDLIAILLYKRRNFSKLEYKKLHPGGSIGANLLFVQDLMHTDDELPLIRSGSSFKDTICIITEKRFGIVGIVSDDGKLIGVFTDGDLRRHIDRNLNITIIDDIMTKDPYTISKDVFASIALKTMNQMQITNLFITDNNVPVGLIHMHDIIKAKVVI